MRLKTLKFLIFAPLMALADSGQLSSFQNKLLPFSSDGCSQFPDSFGKANWLHCCKDHDLEYWAGGTRQEKAQADEKLSACVQQSAGVVLGKLMEAGVEIGGGADLPTSWRWGYGWVVNRGYKPLDNFEMDQVEQLTPKNLNEVPIVPTHAITTRPSVTGNYCLDIALTNISDVKGEKSIDYRILSTKKTPSSNGTVVKLEIITNICATAYSATFLLLKPNACEPPTN